MYATYAFYATLLRCYHAQTASSMRKVVQAFARSPKHADNGNCKQSAGGLWADVQDRAIATGFVAGTTFHVCYCMKSKDKVTVTTICTNWCHMDSTSTCKTCLPTLQRSSSGISAQ